MTQSSAVLESFGVLLKQVVPPSALIHVGVGMGTGPMHQWHNWGVPKVWMLDASAPQLDWAERLAATSPDWHVVAATLAEADSEAEFFHASNPAESSLVPPEKLAYIWPNLRLMKQATQHTSRLDTILSTKISELHDDGLWIIIDCLPVLRILQGAGETLTRCSVVWARVLLRPLPTVVEGGTVEEIESFLAPLGFRPVHVVETNHPAVGEVIFVRDWVKGVEPKIAQLRLEKAALAKECTASTEREAVLRDRCDMLTTSCDEQVKHAAAQKAQLDALNSHFAVLASKHTGLEQEKAAWVSEQASLRNEVLDKAKLAAERLTQLDLLMGERAEQGKHLAGLLGEIDNLRKERDELAKLAAESKSQLDLRDQEKSVLAGANSALAAENGALAQEIEEQKNQVTALTMTNKEQSSFATELRAQLARALEEQSASAALANARTDALEAEKKGSATKLAQLESDLQASQVEVKTLANARDEQAKLADTHQAKIHELTNSCGKLSTENQDLTAAVHEKNASLAKLEEDLSQFHHRERQLTEEIIRAEAQIDLIKDVLLREPGL
jgi:septal ring factor EnvC (AmiA/AmiB activator)